MRLAAIDVGSNSLHMVIAQIDPDGGVTNLWRMKEMVGLGRMSFPSKRLSAPAMDAAIAALAHFQQAARRRDCEKILAVATSAVREAHNGGDFLERVRAETGLTIRVVSAREEARLIYLGVRHAIDLKSFPNLFVDVGGGSVEFIVADRTGPIMLESCKLGAARMTAQFVHTDPISEANLQNLLAHYQTELAPVIKQIRALAPKNVIGSSGTVENLAAMCASLYDSDADAIIAKPFDKLVDRLIDSKSKNRAQIKGLDDQRKDQVLAGALLVWTLMDELKIKRIGVSRSALREGILLDYLSRHLPDLEVRRQVPDPRRRSVLDLARRCNWHQTHSQHVTNLALSLFDQIKSIHKLDRDARELLEYGSLLHDIGWHISKEKHHRHSLYLIQNGELKNFSPDEVQIIANIARYHRGSVPKPEHESFTALSPAAKQIVRLCAGLLRIADGLDRSHASMVSQVRVKKPITGAITITAKGKGDIELELWGARRKRDLLEEATGLNVAIDRAKR